MACPPFSEILMVSQNVRSGGARPFAKKRCKRYVITMFAPFYGNLAPYIMVNRKDDRRGSPG